ncbi:MAG: prepilin peptidase [Sphingomonadaceae bacterium]|nr:prepilin peptidase [Sphingomonadaceae bacterium]
MHGGIFSYALLAALATGLLVAAFTDLRRRQIDNWLTAAIALGAPLFWIAFAQETGEFGWSDAGIQLAIAVATFTALAALFAFGMMGGGDVKLLTALSLWIQPLWFIKLIIVMALVGGVLTLIFGGIHYIRGKQGRVAVPYGIAISAAGLWVLANQHFPQIQSGGYLG